MAASIDNRQFRLLTGVIRPPPPPDMEDDDVEEPFDWTDTIKRANSGLEASIQEEGTADHWIQRNPSLIRLTGKHPFNSEPPLTRLMQSGFITPVAIHYVRNHGAVPRASWEDWTVEVTGLVRRPRKFSMDDLLSEFESREFPVSLVCAGNRRKEENMVKQTVGFNWGSAAASTSVWRGVALHQVLKRCGIIRRRVPGGALNVCFEDLPGGGGSNYGTSVKVEIAMDPARDIILAYMQNGERLSPDHGFPVRVIVPGCIGGRMVKWLKRIVVTTAESDSFYHYRDNRLLPSQVVDAELANAQAWWYKPEYIINELNINSVITTPCHEEILSINSWTTQRPYTLKGYAYTGGGRKVTRVEVTLDGGDTWQLGELEQQEKPSKYGKYWCWCFWSLHVEVLDLLGAKDVAVRAWDDSHNTQPQNLIWNVTGMMNNCWFRVKANVCKPQKGEIGIVFQHPTQAGSQSGGWMARERHMELSSEAGLTLKKSNSSPFMNTSSKKYSMSEVKKHSTAESCWIVVHGHVYDCTRFIGDHPGGANSILINAGTDCTEDFEAIHSDKAKKTLEEYRIGEVLTTGCGYTSSDSTSSSPNSSVHGASNLQQLTSIKEVYALNPREKIPCRLVDKVSLSHDVRRFRFSLPSDDQVLGLPVGKHIFLCATVEGKPCMRAYTPTTTNEEVGYFELVVKIYNKGQHPRFPNGGLMSQHLDSLPLGSCDVEVKGPLGHIEYAGEGHFSVHGKPRPRVAKLAMIAGGTGITPIYQVMQAVLKDPEDRTRMQVVYANRTEEDILLRDELDGWARDYPDRVKVWYVIENPSPRGWKYDTGFITEAILRDHLPLHGNDTLALACGPPPMIQFAVQPGLQKMGYDIKEELLVF